MFTGIIEELGAVEAVERQSDAIRLTVAADLTLDDARPGDSIAVNGCCLTIADRSDTTWTADVMAETLEKTSTGSLAPGDRVNLERAVTMATRLGGHVVQGHAVPARGLLRDRGECIADLGEGTLQLAEAPALGGVGVELGAQD